MADEAALMRCPYEVMGVDRSAGEEQIKRAYKVLALRYHPDKNPEGGDAFRELCTAYAILSDPAKRRRYDLGGYQALRAEDLEVEVDLSSLGLVNTTLAAMFARLGVPIKTAVAAGVLEAAYEGRFEARPLHFGDVVHEKVERQAAQFYQLDITQAHIDIGFVVAAHSAAGARFKLLLFEPMGEGRWELLMQESSQRVRKGSAAGLYCLPFETYSVGPKPSSLETASDPEAALFKRLDTLRQREPVRLRPGPLVVAVYCDNYFKRLAYCLEAVVPSGVAQAADGAQQVRRVEADLLQRKEELRGFELEYRSVQQQYTDLCRRYEEEQQQVDALLREREHAYWQLLGARSSGSAGSGRGGSGDEGIDVQGEAKAKAAGGGSAGSAGADFVLGSSVKAVNHGGGGGGGVGGRTESGGSPSVNSAPPRKPLSLAAIGRMFNRRKA